MPPPMIRPPTANDIPAMTAIYNDAILHTTFIIRLSKRPSALHFTVVTFKASK